VFSRRVLSRRALNRALLDRQLLLQRRTVGVWDAVQHLVGLQAQEPQAPYIGLWTRLAGFQPAGLSDLIAERRAVRTSLMRATIHLVTAEDCLALWPLMRTVLARTFRGSTFAKALDGIDLDEVIAAGRELIAQQPRTRAELSALLARRWPDYDATSLAYAVSFLTPIVQVPPRGLWRQSGSARWTTAQAWLGTELDEGPSLADVVLRYLAAYGPASVRDIQAWCGLTGVRAITERPSDRLRTYVDEQGNELLDVIGAPLPDPQVPAPPRFLPPFDNAILAHADRSRIIAPEHRDTVYRDRLMRTFLVDGFVAGTWSIDAGTLRLTPLAPLRNRDRAALEPEAERLLRFVAPDADRHEVHIATP
jgi:Winged helix DNA-binding domain